MKRTNLEVAMHDGAKIDVEISGEGSTILLPVNPVPIEGERAEEMRKWGVNPSLGRELIDGLNDHFRVVAFDYENHVMAHPKADTLTPDNIAKDFLAIADAAGAEKFAYYGYSWLALSGLQLAIRTDRMNALIMGGFPPIDGPYHAMLAVTKATHDMATAPKVDTQQYTDQENNEWEADEYDWDSIEVTMSGDQTKQFVTLYENLQDFDDRAIQSKLTMPRLTFAGSKDYIDYSEKWGKVCVEIAGPLVDNKDDLVRYGWNTAIIDDADHTKAMQSESVLPIIDPWLDGQNLSR